MFQTIILPFFSGLLLNFMPCTLPIILLKLHDIIRYIQTNNNQKNLKLVSIATSLGIIFIFLIFAILSIVFNKTGKTFHIGFHFQNPYFLIIVIFLLFLFILNLLNFFHLYYSTKILNFLQKKYTNSKKLNKGIFLENFLTGIFLVLFATPCSLPLIGSLSILSMTNDNYFKIIFIFLFLGLGMAFPFFLLIFSNKFLNFLKSKQNILLATNKIIIVILVFILLWLFYIVQTSLGLRSLLLLIAFLSLIVLLFKVNKKLSQNIVFIAFIILIGTFLSIRMSNKNKTNKINDSLWRDNITINEIDAYIKDGRSVFIHILADWCLVCNLNNLNVFSKHKIINFLNENYIAVKIDTTSSSKEAEKFYSNPNHIYVPNYILYNSKYKNGCSFSGNLTEKSFLSSLKNCE